MDRATSSSAQRVKALLRGVRRHPIAVDASRAFQAAGLRVDRLSIQANESGSDYVLTAAGWHEDGTPFAFASKPFVGDPIERARQAAADLAKAHTGAQAAPHVNANTQQRTTVVIEQKDAQGKPAAEAAAKPAVKPSLGSPTRLKGVASRFKARRDAFDHRLGDFEKKSDEVMTRNEHYLDGEEAELKAMEDDLNQLTNE